MLICPVVSGNSESITITNEKGRLSQEDIDRMVREAEEFASEDEAQRKRIEALNGLQNYVSFVPYLIAHVVAYGRR
jgi:molecular chaperone DnaK (HSP70)